MSWIECGRWPRKVVLVVCAGRDGELDVMARLRAVLCRDSGPGRGCWRRGCRGCWGSGSSGCLLGRGGGPGCWYGGRGLRAAYLVQLGLWVVVSCGVVVSRGCGASPRGLCRVVVWFSPGFFHNKPGTFCLINIRGKAFASRFKKKLPHVLERGQYYSQQMAI